MKFEELFAGSFLEELCTIEDLEPNAELEPTETVIGDMNALEKKAYALSVKYAKMFVDLNTRMQFDVYGKDRTAMKWASDSVQDIADAIRGIVWSSIKSRIAFNSDLAIGVRRGFKVVTFKSPSRSQMPEKLQELIKQIGGSATVIKLDPKDD